MPMLSATPLLSLAALWLLAAPDPASGQDQDTLAAFDCPVTPREERLPVIAVMAGRHPVWMVDGSDGRWLGSSHSVKTVWVVARNHPGDLIVTGRRLDGKGQVQFQGHRGTPPGPELMIPKAHEALMLPGGASREIIDTYAFRPSYVVYPSPGCWEMTVRLGEADVQIIIELALSS